jgi:hypothetical protein
VKELRLAGISTMEAANGFLPAFVQTYNARFAKPSLSVPTTMWQSRSIAAKST